MRNFQNVRPLDCRIIDIVRAHRRPEPIEIRGPMSEAIKWLNGNWDRPMLGFWTVNENGWVWLPCRPIRVESLIKMPPN